MLTEEEYTSPWDQPAVVYSPHGLVVCGGGLTFGAVDIHSAAQVETRPLLLH